MTQTERITSPHLSQGDRVQCQPIDRDVEGAHLYPTGTYTIASIDSDSQGVTVHFEEGGSSRGGHATRWTRESNGR